MTPPTDRSAGPATDDTAPEGSAADPGPDASDQAVAAHALGPADEPDLVIHEEDGPGPAGPGANLVAGLAALALAVFGVVGAVGLGVGSPARPEPGTWPFVISVVIGVLALAQLLVGRRGSGGERFSRASLIPVVGFLTLLAMVALMPVVGFEIPAALLCFVWLKILGGESWRSALLGSVLIPVAFYLIFIAALGTSVPHLF
ncbi:hypothetical protein BH708_04270 [Brachybacterium sp. P6-10-X1]|uniref:tripartite tricarboxylate transporter TctB family protein n=1 Tax=Brachybacterium sp. P6-10-X1 TaxID=1903186 RepID=UPI0009718FBF|nr:tripartite tricarboxylate transporter TctB family protein [Brachybacterium sp. P6-10-X1]APX34623.1 hypothetical protein BH708_04270 [Brachybacterium sp. P6-10-X1]